MTDSHDDISSVSMVAKLLFPYEFKYDQKEILEKITAADYSLFSAPTGYGKTSIALASILAHTFLPGSKIKHIIVLVRTKTQIFRIIDECRTIVAAARQKRFYHKLHVVPLMAKDELCIHQTQPKGHIQCQKLKCRHYPKWRPLPSNTKFETLLTDYDLQPYTSSAQLKECLTTSTGGCCPYYLVRALLLHAHIIVTTHSWLLNPNLRQVLLTELPFDPASTALIIDEVHHFLTPYKTELSSDKFLAALTVARKYHFECQNFLEKLLNFFKNPDIRNFSHFSNPKIEPWRINQIISASTQLQNTPFLTPDDQKGLQGLEAVVTLFRSEGDYWYFDTVINKEQQMVRVLGHIHVYVPLYFRIIAPFRRVLLMSATLYSQKLYKKLFDLRNITLIEAKPQPKTSFLAVYTGEHLSSRQNNRDISLFIQLVKAVRYLHLYNPQHTIVFSPSHPFTKDLVAIHKRNYPEEHINVENNSVNNQLLLGELQMKQHELVYATFGGSFSEGIEIVDPATKKSKLKLIIFAGLPIPPPSSAQDIAWNAYTIQYNEDIARFLVESLPTYQMLMQAAGRGIRQPTDACAIVCLDYRLALTNIFPQETIIRVNQLADLLSLLEKFFC